MSDPTPEPLAFRAGDSYTWSRLLPEYLPGDGWVLKYRLLRTTGAAIDIDSVPLGDEHAVTLDSADTASWAAGAATLVVYVESLVARVTLEQRAVTILPDLTVAANFDGRTANQKALADARAALADYMKKGQAHVEEYDIAGRKMKFRASSEIIALINHYEREVVRERGGIPGRVYTRF